MRCPCLVWRPDTGVYCRYLQAHEAYSAAQQAGQTDSVPYPDTVAKSSHFRDVIFPVVTVRAVVWSLTWRAASSNVLYWLSWTPLHALDIGCDAASCFAEDSQPIRPRGGQSILFFLPEQLLTVQIWHSSVFKGETDNCERNSTFCSMVKTNPWMGREFLI